MGRGRHKVTQEELDRIIQEAREAVAKECPACHPVKHHRCQKPKGHEGQHFFQFCIGSKVWSWED